MEIIEVKSVADREEFLQLPIRLYRNEPRWIRPLDKDIESVFDPKVNKYFRHGVCTRWILKKNGKTIGRIAAFIDEKTKNKDNDQPTGGTGFFECVNDQDAANTLFETAKKWLEEQGIEAMDGPVNFGTRENWWGCLAEGFDLEPNYKMPYNFPYYNELFQNYGFELYFRQFTYGMNTTDHIPQKIKEKAERIARDPRYHFMHLQKKQIEKFTEDFRIIFNKAWVGHKGMSKMSSLQAKAIMKQLKPIMEPGLVWFTYYDDEPVGFFIIIPEVNQIFKHVNGKLDLIGKLKFLYHKLAGSCKKMFGVVFGIVPDHQGKGLEGALIMATRKHVLKHLTKYERFEMNWIGDFNPKMIHLVSSIVEKPVKVHHTYRYLFDRNKPFKRAPMMEAH